MDALERQCVFDASLVVSDVGFCLATLGFKDAVDGDPFIFAVGLLGTTQLRFGRMEAIELRRKEQECAFHFTEGVA